MKSTRWFEITPSQFAWEREALDYIKARLPDGEPFRAWSNFEFIADDGSVNEVDLLVVSIHKVYLVEIKSWSGVISGDPSTWRRKIDGNEFLVDNPLLLANRKAKKLIGLLKSQKALAKHRRPFVEAVVFLSRSGVRCRLDGRARTGVYLASESERDRHPSILDVLLGNAGFDPRHPPARIDRLLSRAFARAMEQAGIRPSQRQRRVADYMLRKLLLETDSYQDWEAEHASVSGSKRRVRIFPLARASSEAVRSERRRAAEREFQLLDGVAHDGILRVEQLTSAEPGPALVFEHDPDAERLDRFFERGSADALDLATRLDLLRQLAEALKYAHERRIHHRGLHPGKVLVTAPDTERPKLKIFDWGTGEDASRRGSGVHVTPSTGAPDALGVSGDDEADVYLAPETIQGGCIPEKLDIFSLGAIGYRLFSGRPPASTVMERARKRWSRHRWMTPLRDTVARLVAKYGGIVTPHELAEALAATRGSTETGDTRQRRAGAVAAAALEMESVRDDARYRLHRLEASDGAYAVILATEILDPALTAPADARVGWVLGLGKLADEIADADPLLAPVRVTETLAEVTSPAGMQPLAPDRVLHLAAQFAERAAVSSRGELYPRGMTAERAAKLGASSLLGPTRLSEEDIRKRIASRYPEAEPLPERPMLDDLLEAAGLKLEWDAAARKYHSRAVRSSYASSTLTVRSSGGDDDVALHADAMDERLERVVKTHGFLALSVAPRYLSGVERYLATTLDLTFFSLEAGLIRHMHAVAGELGADWKVVVAADAAPSGSADRRRLDQLVRRATPGLGREIANRPEPLLLTRPGLLARYRQLGVLTESQAEYRAAREAERTGDTFLVWRNGALTQAAVAWILGCVFVRFVEDNGLVEAPLIAGPGERNARAADRRTLYFRGRPTDSDRDCLLYVFAEVARLPGLSRLYDRDHNPVWRHRISGDAARDLLVFWRTVDPDSGAMRHDFTDSTWDTRFLGDLYQDLSEEAKKRYALLQTPEFVEEFILDRTLTPALDEFGLPGLRLIDPACGSGHFLLGAFPRLLRAWFNCEPGTPERVLVQRALDGVHGVDINPFAAAIARFRLLVAALRESRIELLWNYRRRLRERVASDRETGVQAPLERRALAGPGTTRAPQLAARPAGVSHLLARDTTGDGADPNRTHRHGYGFPAGRRTLRWSRRGRPRDPSRGAGGVRERPRPARTALQGYGPRQTTRLGTHMGATAPRGRNRRRGRRRHAATGRRGRERACGSYPGRPTASKADGDRPPPPSAQVPRSRLPEAELLAFAWRTGRPEGAFHQLSANEPGQRPNPARRLGWMECTRALRGARTPRAKFNPPAELRLIMPIPELNQNGLLPRGVHDCTLVEIADFFGVNAHRRQLCQNFVTCLEQEIRPVFSPYLRRRQFRHGQGEA